MTKTGFPRNIFALGAVSLLTDVSREMIFPILPIFLRSVLGAGTAFIGLVEGVAESAASILNLLSGWLSDRMRRRKTLMIWGYGLSALTRPLIALATSGWHILVVRFVEKIGKGIRVPPRDALIAASCTVENRGRGFGLHRTMDNIGSIMGPLLAFSLLSFLRNDYRAFFWLAALPAFLAIFVLLFLVQEKGEVNLSDAPRTFRQPFNFRQFDRPFLLFLAISVLFELANSSNAFLLLRVKEVGLPTELIPIIYLFCNIFKAASSLPGGVLSDILGRRNLLALGWLVYGGCYLLFGFPFSLPQAWFIFALYGLFSGMTEGIKKALVADLVTEEARGSAYGIHSFLTNLTQLPASLILGILWQKWGVFVAFSCGAFFALSAGVLLLTSIPSRTRA